ARSTSICGMPTGRSNPSLTDSRPASPNSKPPWKRSGVGTNDWWGGSGCRPERDAYLHDEVFVMGLPNPGMILEPGRTALVLTDLQNDFLNPGGNGWALFAESYARNGTVENLERLLKAAKAAGLPVLISPHYYYPTDKHWTAPGSATEAL